MSLGSCSHHDSGTVKHETRGRLGCLMEGVWPPSYPQSRGLPHSAVQHHDHSLEPELKTEVWVSSAVSVSSVC